MPIRPTSNEAKAQRGERPCRMRDTITLPAGVPECPITLNTYGQDAWDRLVRVLRSARVLTKADGPAVALIARALGDLEEARVKMIETGGAVVPSKRGDPVSNPWAREHQRAFDNVRRLLTEFGLTPAARLKVQRTGDPKKAKSDPLEGMLNGRAR